MRIHQVMLIMPALPDLRLQRNLIRISAGIHRLKPVEHLLINLILLLLCQFPHKRGRLLRIIPRQGKDQALQIGGNQDIHGRRSSLVEGTMRNIIDARLNEIRQNIIGVAGTDQPANRQARTPCIVGGQNIPEVAGGDTEIHFLTGPDLAIPDQIGIGGEIIDDLRNQTAEIDGVRRGQNPSLLIHRPDKFAASKYAFYAALGIIKVSLDGDHVRIPSARRHHLQALGLADTIFRIEHGTPCPRNIQKTFQCRFPGIPAGGNQNKDFPFLPVLSRTECEEMRQKLKGHILECQRGAVPELQRVGALIQLYQRRNPGIIKARPIRAMNGLFQFINRKIRQKSAEYFQRAFLIGCLRQIHNRFH